MRLFRRRDAKGRAHGSWIAQFFDVDGRRHERSTHAHDRQAAEAIAREWERAAADPAVAAAQAATLIDALEALVAQRYESSVAGKGSADTVDFYRRKAGHLVRILGADYRLAKLTAAEVDRYVSLRRGEDVTDHTILKELTTLRAALRLAKRHGRWLGQVADVMPVSFGSGYVPRTRWVSLAELRSLLAELPPDRAARVAFMVATSAEWGATMRALRADVSADLAQVLVRGTKRPSRWRQVPVVLAEGRNLLAYAMQHAEGTDGRLFTPWVNHGRDLKAACVRAGIAAVSPNDLRRTTAMWHRAGGAPLELIAPLMGHVDTTMVQRVYGKLDPALLAQRLTAALACSGFAARPWNRWHRVDTLDTPPKLKRLRFPGETKPFLGTGGRN